MALRKWVLASVAGLAIVAAQNTASAEDYQVVIVQSLTGAAAFIGAGVKDGMLLAADELNAAEALGPGNKLSIVVDDDASDRTQTLSLMTRHGSDPKVLAIMGPTSGAVAIAGAQVANELKVPIMTTSNSMDVLNAGEWSFILTQPGDVTIPFIGKYAVEKLGVKNCAIIGIREIEAYVTLQKEFEKYITSNGGQLASVDGIAGADSDFAALATKIASAEQDCVFISSPAPQAANIVIQLRQAGLDPAVPILGHNSLASPAFVTTGGAAVEGVYLMGDWAPGGNTDLGKAFDKAFTDKYGHAPDNWNAVGYGGMRVLANALKNAGAAPTRDAVRAALAATKDVEVVVGQGNFTLDEKRIPRPGMNILMVKDGAFTLAP
jgi:branched-chain amino acid transport system substrate-binding protein